MWGNLAILGLKLLLQFIPMIFARSAQKEEYERLVKASIYVWEKRTGRAAKLRKDHRRTDEKLDEEWAKKWGTPAPTAPIPPAPENPLPSGVTISAPANADSGQAFGVEVIGAPINAEIWRDGKWKVIALGGRTNVMVSLTVPGNPVELSVRSEDKVLATHLMVIHSTF